MIKCPFRNSLNRDIFEKNNTISDLYVTISNYTDVQTNLNYVGF